MNQDSKKIWSAVTIKPNQSRKAEANLSQQGFSYLAPKINVTKRQQNRFINKSELLFPGYIFVLINTDSSDVRKVQSTHGISNIIRVGNRIGEIPEPFIQTIKSSFVLNHNFHAETLAPGQQVKIIKGPFAGLIGKLSQVDTSARVKCLFNLISGEVSASALKEDLIAVY